MLLGVLVSLTLAGPPVTDCERVRCPRIRERPDAARGYAFFEFAPASGTGMGAACACTTPTGAKGEAMTFTRASSGTCLKGGTVSSIANGDMVTCSTNEARVMPGGDGSGGLGLLVEGARTNSCLRSEEFDNAAWVKAGNVAAAPTVTANQAVGPDGATTADRVQFAATNGGAEFSVVDQVCGIMDYTGTVFIKGNGGSGAVDIDCNNGTDHCSSCSFNPSTWTRCSCASGGAGASLFIIGNYQAGCGGGNHAAADVFLVGGDAEAGAFASSYIATTSAAVTRAADSAYFPFSPTLTNGSIAATLMPHGVTGATEISWAALQDNAGPTYDRLLVYIDANAFRLYGSTGSVTVAAAAPTAGVASRLAGDWTGTNANVYYAGTSTSGAIGAPVSQQRLTIGNYASTTAPAFGVVKQVCVDPSQSRCR